MSPSPVRIVVLPLLVLCALAAALPLAPGRSQPARAEANPGASDLYAAASTLAEVTAQLAGDGWVEILPVFENADFANDAPAGFAAGVTREYQRHAANGDLTGLAVVVIDLYKDEASAKAHFASGAAADADGATPLTTEKIGDEMRAFTFAFSADAAPSAQTRQEAFMRFRAGRATALVDLYGSTTPTAAQLVALAKSTATHLAQVTAGTLTAPALSAGLAPVMPAAAATDAVGPVVGQAEVTAATYATRFADDVELATARLVALGATTAGMRTYGVEAAPTLYVNVFVIPLKDEASARDFVLFDDDGTPSNSTLDTGSTGPASIFRKVGTTHYDLQFARNKYAVNLVCAPFDWQEAVGAECEAATRALAEATYANLPASTLTYGTVPFADAAATRDRLLALLGETTIKPAVDGWGAFESWHRYYPKADISFGPIGGAKEASPESISMVTTQVGGTKNVASASKPLYIAFAVKDAAGNCAAGVYYGYPLPNTPLTFVFNGACTAAAVQAQVEAQASQGAFPPGAVAPSPTPSPSPVAPTPTPVAPGAPNTGVGTAAGDALEGSWLAAAAALALAAGAAATALAARKR